MTDIRVTSVGDDAIEHHNPGIFSITVEPRFDWAHQRFGACLYDCDFCYTARIISTLLLHLGGETIRDTYDGMFVLDFQYQPSRQAWFVGACLYDCDGSEHSQLEHILPFLGGAGRSCDYAGPFSIQFAHTASFFGSYHGACILFMIVILLFYKIKTYILLTRSLVDIADLVILVAFFTLTHLSLILLQR